MAKKDNSKKEAPKIEIFNVSLSQIDRGYKGIDEWRRALKAAESITNPRRKQLYDLYDEITLDMHLTSVMEKRKMKVTNTTIKFFDRNGKEHPVINKLIEKEAFEEIIKDVLDSRFYGYSLLWFNSITLEKIDYKLINRRHVRPESNIVVKQVNDSDGVNYTEDLYKRFILSAGNSKDFGLLNKAAVGVIYKKGDISDWSVFAQVFGTPFREFTYEGNDPNTKNELEKIAKNTTTAPYAIMPSNANMKVHDSVSKSGSGTLYKQLADFCDEQISKLILLNTMTTDAKGGNYKGEIHAQSEKEVEKADKKFVLRILNEKFIYILENFGFDVEGGYFTYEEKEQLTLKERLELDEKLAKIIDIDDDYFYETYNVPKPKNPKKQNKKESEIEPEETITKPEKKEEKQETNTTEAKKELKEKRGILHFFEKLFSFSPFAG